MRIIYWAGNCPEIMVVPPKIQVTPTGLEPMTPAQCTGIADVMGSNPLKLPEIFKVSKKVQYCLNCPDKCEDLCYLLSSAAL